MKLRVLVAGLGLLALSGCAYNTASRVASGDVDTDGIRVYDCKPLVLVQEGKLEVIYVPDPSKVTAVRFGAFLAKNDTTIKFGANCGITEIIANQDSTAALSTIENVLNKIPTTRSFMADAESGGSGRIELYEILFEADGSIIGLKPIYGRGVRH